MSGKKCNLCAGECFPGVNYPAEAIDEDVGCLNDVAESFGVGSLGVVHENFANFPSL
jgi:hypothetical protein